MKPIIVISIVLLTMSAIPLMAANVQGYSSGFVSLEPSEEISLSFGSVLAGYVLTWYIDPDNYSSMIQYCIQLPDLNRTPFEYSSPYGTSDSYLTNSAGTYYLIIWNSDTDFQEVYYWMDSSLSPVITIESPEDGEVNPNLLYSYGSSYFSVTGEVNGLVNMGSCHDLTFYVDDVWKNNHHFHPYASSYDFNIMIPYDNVTIQDGSHVLRLDLKINYEQVVASEEIIIIFDSTPPSLEIAAPYSGSYFNTSYLNVSWDGFDEATGIDKFEIKNNHQAWIDVGLEEYYNFTSLADGNLTILVRATDKANQTSTASVQTIKDTKAPAILKLTPYNGSVSSSPTIQVQWDANDSNSGVEHFEISVDGGEWIDIQLSEFYQLDGLSSGSHLIQVRAFDHAGNMAVRSTVVNIDTNALSLSGPYGGLPLLILIAIIGLTVGLMLLIKFQHRNPPKP